MKFQYDLFANIKILILSQTKNNILQIYKHQLSKISSKYS